MTLIPRSMATISVYVDPASKTVSSDFNHDDWTDICTGLKRDMKYLKKQRGSYAGSNTWAEIAVSRAVSKLSEDRLLRVAYLTLRVLVPSRETFNPHPAKDFDELLSMADETLIGKWYQEINLFIVPLLKEVFNRLYGLQIRDFMGYVMLPEDLMSFIIKLQEEAELLPIYWTDFKGVIVNDEIYHEPATNQFMPVCREASWKGGHHIKRGQIHTNQICKQGGSFGPICLSIIEHILQ